MTSLALVICTYHREQLLAEALASIAAQQPQPDCDFRVIVVDNSDAGTARQTVAAARAGFPFALEWIEAHPANISVARNAGVAAATGAFVAFLDDDQQLRPGWLEAVARELPVSPFDAWFGAVEASFEAPGRATPLVRQLFSRSIAASSGTDLFAMGPLKTQGIALATNNSIFRRSAMLADGAPFDVAFGVGGGEDYDLLCRMQRRGSRFGWLPGAAAREYVPAGRCQPEYLRRRFYAGGQAFAAAVAKSSPHPLAARWLLRAKALVQAALLLPRLPLVLWRGGHGLADYSFVWAGVFGKLSGGAIHPLYADTVKQNVAAMGMPRKAA